MHIIRLKFLLLALIGAGIAFGAGNTAHARDAVIAGSSSGGVGYVTSSTSPDGISAQIGRWDAPYPGWYSPSLEPYGTSYFYIDVDVNDGGLVSFSYRLRTYDAGIWDWYDIYLVTPTGTVSLVNHLGKPGSDYGTYWESSTIALTQGLDRWRNQQVRFVFAVRQDGWGDQTVGEVINFGVRTCEVPPLTAITDPLALQFENGQRIDTEHLTARMQTGLICLQTAVENAHGTFNLTSAYRPEAYQLHLQEVWDRWNDLRRRREPECLELRNAVQAEFQRHGLLLSQRPVTNSLHERGEAIDANITLPVGQNVDTLANGCQLRRPLPQRDPVHFIHQ